MDTDEDGEDDVPLVQKIYLTPGGFARMSEEWRQLMKVERPKIVETVSWAAGNGDRSENGDYLYGKKRLREIDKRARYLTKRLRAAEVVDPSRVTERDRVFFGATVTYVYEDETERTVTIVGAEEAGFSRGEVSLHSPIARALLRARLGDQVKMHGPNGPVLLEIIEISYPDGASS
jgi:transcription elongation factor GreB